MPGQDLTKEFLEALYAKITGKKINVKSPSMGAPAEGQKRLFRGEIGENKANRETGQVFTSSLPDAIRHMDRLGGEEAGARVHAVDVPEEIFDKSSSTARQDSGRIGIKKALEGGDRIGKPRGQNNPNFIPPDADEIDPPAPPAYPLIKGQRDANLHFLIRKLANRKEQIIPIAIAAGYLTEDGQFTEKADPRFQREFKAATASMLPSGTDIAGFLAGLIPGAGTLESASRLVPEALSRENANTPVNTGLDEDQYYEKLSLGENPKGSPVWEPKTVLDDLTLEKALALLGLGGAMKGKRLYDQNKADKAQRPIRAKMAEERIPPGSNIQLSDLKDIGNEPYPSGAATGKINPVTPSIEEGPMPPKHIRKPTPENDYNYEVNPYYTSQKPKTPMRDIQGTVDRLDDDKEAFSKKVVAARAAEPKAKAQAAAPGLKIADIIRIINQMRRKVGY